MRGHRSSRGFSTLEIIVALVLVGVLSAFSIAPMKDYLTRLQFEQSVDGIKRVILLSKSKAAANPLVHCGVYFDIGRESQKVIAFQDLDSPLDYQYDQAGDKAYREPYVLKKGVSISVVPGFPNALIFRGDGSAYESVKLVVRYASLVDTLDVLASTGRVKISR